MQQQRPAFAAGARLARPALGVARPARTSAVRVRAAADNKVLPAVLSTFDDEVKEQSRKYRRTVGPRQRGGRARWEGLGGEGCLFVAA
ncbi:hypothetical protein MNEG_16526, partial [Monoraphidium neglectum]